MNYFNINISEMPQQSQMDRFLAKLEAYLCLKELDIHQSTINNNILFYWRIFSMVLLTVVYVWTIVVIQKSLFQNVMYLTMIGYLVTWIYFGICIQDYLLRGKGINIKKFCYFVEIINQIGVCIEVPITLVFWGVLFKIVLGLSGVTTQIVVINGFLHSAPLICLIVDFVLNHFSFPYEHISIVIIFDIIYLIINLSYSLAMKPIYQPIDWVSWGSYVIAVVTLVLTVFIHYIGRLVHRKWKIHKLKNQSLIQEENRNELSERKNPIFMENNDL